MKFVLPPLPAITARQDSACKRNAWYANAGWRLRTQIAERARAGFDEPMPAPVVISIALPEDAAGELEGPARTIIGLLCRHGVIAAEPRGLSVFRHNGDNVEVTLEPAVLCSEV